MLKLIVLFSFANVETFLKNVLNCTVCIADDQMMLIQFTSNELFFLNNNSLHVLYYCITKDHILYFENWTKHYKKYMKVIKRNWFNFVSPSFHFTNILQGICGPFWELRWSKFQEPASARRMKQLDMSKLHETSNKYLYV